MSYKHLTLNERNKIEVLNKEGYSSRRIEKILGCHHSTIARELKRCDSEYEAHLAERDKKSKSSLKGRKIKANYEILESTKEKLNSKWPPEQIVGFLYKGILSFKTIYNWIYSGVIDFNISKLRRKDKSRKSKEIRGKFNIGIYKKRTKKHKI
jgi:putative transposase